MGLEAIADNTWALDVFYGNSVEQDWTFEVPRAKHVARPSSLKKISQDRTGTGNPACKNHATLNKTEFESEIKKMWENSLEEGNVSFSVFKRRVGERFKGWAYSYADSKEKGSSLLRKILGIDKAEFDAMYLAIRGNLISKGQRQSPGFMEMARRAGANLVSTWRISRPHRELMEMIASVDNEATIEHRMKMDGSHVSYDIFSPKINALIEMHGRVWHDASKTNDALRALTEANVRKDFKKAEYATRSGFKFLVFWSDEQHLWESNIEREYGIKPISIQEAKNRVYQIPGYERYVRPRNVDAPQLRSK